MQALLEYEKHKREIGELEFPDAPIPEPTLAENAVKFIYLNFL